MPRIGNMSDMDWLNAKADAANKVELDFLRKAKAEATKTGKETFSYQKLITMYDPTTDMATKIFDPKETADALERRYYIDYPKVKNLRDFAVKMTLARTSR